MFANSQHSNQSSGVRVFTHSSMQRPSSAHQSPCEPTTPKSRHLNKEKRSRRSQQQSNVHHQQQSQQQAMFTPGSIFGSHSRKTQSCSPPIPCYAGGKWSDSPSARSIPLPPDQWIEEFSSSSSSASSDSEGSMSSCDIVPPVLLRSSPQPPSGVRLCPMQLIKVVGGSPVSN